MLWPVILRVIKDSLLWVSYIGHFPAINHSDFRFSELIFFTTLLLTNKVMSSINNWSSKKLLNINPFWFEEPPLISRAVLCLLKASTYYLLSEGFFLRRVEPKHFGNVHLPFFAPVSQHPSFIVWAISTHRFDLNSNGYPAGSPTATAKIEARRVKFFGQKIHDHCDNLHNKLYFLTWIR